VLWPTELTAPGRRRLAQNLGASGMEGLDARTARWRAPAPSGAPSSEPGDDGMTVDKHAYSLIDCGAGRRLERFGQLLVDRPAPGVTGPRRLPDRWAGAIAYHAGRGWVDPDGGAPAIRSSTVKLAGIPLVAALGVGGQVGVFPEHAVNGDWLREAVRRRGGGDGSGSSSGPAVLNLFAHTGLLTLVAAAAGASVAHVDSSRPAVQGARRNAAAAGLADRPIRWLVDDALDFARREARRGRRYAGLILDPPSYGHGGSRGSRSAFRFEQDIDELLAACTAVAEPDAFWLLSTHTTGWDPARLAATFAGLVAGRARTTPAPLTLVAESGVILELGSTVQFDPRRDDPA
jgi:23S rRNA (cytosine1962-C5)-methyltransferase